jgi:EAL domain-containing protein (putative c-di-GMP-specific phosphodiesterase class I)
MSVNVSASQLRTPGFVDRVRDELADSSCRPAGSSLELTESLLVRGGGVD